MKKKEIMSKKGSAAVHMILVRGQGAHRRGLERKNEKTKGKKRGRKREES